MSLFEFLLDFLSLNFVVAIFIILLIAVLKYFFIYKLFKFFLNKNNQSKKELNSNEENKINN